MRIVDQVEAGWRFEVTESFRITGRGIAVFGQLDGLIERSGLPAELTVDSGTTRLPQIAVESARRAGTDELVLFIPDRSDLLPTGAVLSGPIG